MPLNCATVEKAYMTIAIGVVPSSDSKHSPSISEEEASLYTLVRVTARGEKIWQGISK